MENPNVDKNFEWFQNNVDKIVKEHKISEDDCIVISNQKFVKKFRHWEEAYMYAMLNLSEDGYIIQKLSDLDPDSFHFGILENLLKPHAKNN